jgi:molybdopterin-guanine dinucleotide biosynthesis protein
MELTTPFSMLVAASSKSGKTALVKDILINHYFVFDKPISEIVWAYHPGSRDDDLFSDLKNSLAIPITFVEGFPEKQIKDATLFRKSTESKCLVLDDTVVSALKCPSFIDLFTVLSHHQNINVIAVLQNLHADTSSQRQIMNNVIRNVTYLVLFPDRRQVNACKQIARTYFAGEEEKLMRPFRHLIESKIKYNYMVIDFNDDDNPIKFNALRETDEAFVFTGQ